MIFNEFYDKANMMLVSVTLAGPKHFKRSRHETCRSGPPEGAAKQRHIIREPEILGNRKLNFN